MGRKYFGTDGVRGTVGKEPMSAEFALRLASAAAQVLVPEGGKVLIGNSGADYGVRGYLSAYDVASGALAWRFYTVPGGPSRPM